MAGKIRPWPEHVVRAVLLCAGALVVTWLAMPSPVGSLAWIPSPAPALIGPYAENQELRRAERVFVGRVQGAEDVVFGPDGRAFASLADGRIVALAGDELVEVARVPGRALGLAFAPDGSLYGCVPRVGLVRIELDRAVMEVVVDVVEGVPVRYANAVAVASDGSVYFTDSSAVWEPGQLFEEVLDQRPSGRVMRFDPHTMTTRVLVRDLAFANGLALLPDESALVVAETARYRLWRVWLTGDQRNLAEVVVENLPGFPDNLSVTPRGTFWVGFFSTRKRVIDRAHPSPLVKDALASLPSLFRPRWVRWGFVLELDASFRPLRSLQDPEGVVIASVTAAREHQGQLWLGSLSDDGIPRVRLP
jgi:sugar lactone lactonase YvrE